MNLFYFFLKNSDFASIKGEEARHCVRVMRQKVGDRVYGIDGEGVMYSGKIVGLGKDLVEVALRERTKEWGEHPYKVCLAISPLRQADRFEWLVEKAVELGVTEVVPVITRRTVKARIRMDRLGRIMQAALKQCKRSRLPVLFEPEPISHYLERVQGVDSLRLMGWCEEETETLGAHMEAAAAAQRVDLLVGPEGGFDVREVEAGRTAGFAPVSLGTNRLRAETAGVTLLSWTKFAKGF